MAAPTYLITQNQPDSHQSNPGWVVAFVRYKHPACGYTTRDTLLETKPMMIIQNDDVGVSISNSKRSFSKSCTIIIKSADVHYQSAISPGDWVSVWLHEDMDHINQITRTLFTKARPNKDFSSNLNNWNSGLKFVGRVMSVSAPDVISANGQRTVSQRVQCASFIELDSSVYFTFMATAQFQSPGRSSDDAGAKLLNSGPAVADKQKEYLLGQERFRGFTDAFKEFFNKSMVKPDSGGELDWKSGYTPDRVIQFLMIYLLGIDKKDFLPPGSQIRGHYNDAIIVPKQIADITGVDTKAVNPTRLWQFYNVILGLQTYKANTSESAAQPYKRFAPDFDANSGITHKSIFMRTRYPLKGWVFWNPPTWSNVSLWSIFNQYLHPLLNEMYTVMRCDQYNRIRPTIVVREQPFSTGLFEALVNPKMVEIAPSTPTKNTKTNTQSRNVKKAINKNTNKAEPDEKFRLAEATIEKQQNAFMSKVPRELTTRSMFHNIPRWVIDDSMIISVDTSASESNRCNFVQVWGKNGGSPVMSGPGKNGAFNSQEGYKIAQMIMKNYVADDKDIARNGLRASILDSEHDFLVTGGSLSPYWARMKADHLFNGHLKLSGTIECIGISAPICEGDNLEVRGIVYHIESVTHAAMLSANGRKSFRTSISVSNGILKSSLVNDKDLPVYQSVSRSARMEDQNSPGLTDYESQREEGNQ